MIHVISRVTLHLQCIQGDFKPELIDVLFSSCLCKDSQQYSTRLLRCRVVCLRPIQPDAEFAESTVLKNMVKLILHHFGLFRHIKAIDVGSRLCLVSPLACNHGFGSTWWRQTFNRCNSYPICTLLLNRNGRQICNNIRIQIEMALELIEQLRSYRSLWYMASPSAVRVMTLPPL